jgi:hypothetical protein
MDPKQDNTPRQMTKIPQTLADLDRAIMLLGNRTKVELKSVPRKELEQLIGDYPNLRVAARWKAELTQLRKERIAASKPSTEVEPAPSSNEESL